MSLDILNLDELTELEREICIRGVNYPVVERSVGVMLDSIKIAKMTRAGAHKVDETEFFNNMIKTIRTIVPDCPEEVVRGLTMRQMVAIIEFCNQDPNKMAAEAAAAGVKEGQATEEGAVQLGEA